MALGAEPGDVVNALGTVLTLPDGVVVLVYLRPAAEEAPAFLPCIDSLVPGGITCESAPLIFPVSDARIFHPCKVETIDFHSKRLDGEKTLELPRKIEMRLQKLVRRRREPASRTFAVGEPRLRVADDLAPHELPASRQLAPRLSNFALRMEPCLDALACLALAGTRCMPMGGAVPHELRDILVAGQAVGREQDAALLVDGAEADVGTPWVKPENRAFGRFHLHVVAELDDEGPAAPDDGLPLFQPALDAPVMVARHQGMAVLGYDWYAWHLPRLLFKKISARISLAASHRIRKRLSFPRLGAAFVLSGAGKAPRSTAASRLCSQASASACWYWRPIPFQVSAFNLHGLPWSLVNLFPFAYAGIITLLN